MNNELTMNYELPSTNCPNRRKAPSLAATTNKPPIQPRLPNNYNIIMQNKANFSDDQMNVNKVLTKDYEEMTLGEYGKNEPKTNPNKAKQSQIQKGQNERK